MKILILEDNEDRIAAFRKALSTIDDIEVHIWQDAHSMIHDLAEQLQDADLISLDHDLTSLDGTDPGDGLDVAKWLKGLTPTCPVLIHSTNYERSWAMLLELQEGGWDAERHPPVGMGEDWIFDSWIETVRRQLNKHE